VEPPTVIASVAKQSSGRALSGFAQSDRQTHQAQALVWLRTKIDKSATASISGLLRYARNDGGN
jgi:hypothetical protein